LTKGWELLSISTITSGSPFTVYSGIQQTVRERLARTGQTRLRQPDLSSAGSSTRPRDDYFGRGTNNASFFSIPVGIAGGTGPNSGRFGTLGRNTFRGPAYYDFDLRSSRRLRLATEKAVWSERTCSSAQSYFNLFKHRQHGATCEHHRGYRVWHDQQGRGNLTAIQFSLKLIY